MPSSSREVYFFFIRFSMLMVTESKPKMIATINEPNAIITVSVWNSVILFSPPFHRG